VIEADSTLEYMRTANDPLNMEPEALNDLLLSRGCWPFIRQRPYGIIANPADKPVAIFVSAFDTAPLAPDFDFPASRIRT